MERHDKLVRDGIPAKIEAKGELYSAHTADEAEFFAKLDEKLQEEVAEYLKDRDPDELIDIMEVVLTLARERHDMTAFELDQSRKAKAARLGSFVKRIILEES